LRLSDEARKGCVPIANATYRVDRSYAWNYSHAPALPRLRRLPVAPGGRLFDYRLNSQVGISAGPLLNSKWVEGYSRLGFDILTYSTVRSSFWPAYSLPNIRHVENREQVAVTARRPSVGGDLTLAVSLGTPSMEPDVWRKDVRRAKERVGSGQILIVSVIGTPTPGGDAEALINDYARCAAWAVEAGADIIEIHLACPDPFAEQPQMVYENIPLSAQILHRVRTTVPVPILAKVGAFRTPRSLHETATKLASWAHDGSGRDRADVVGADTFPVSVRQVSEMLAWRKAGAWNRAILAVGGITTVERADALLRGGADAALVATAALFDPLFATRFRQSRAA
jgi:dihydroorotate dehydrogenase (NAD+) catalytic subunit